MNCKDFQKAINDDNSIDINILDQHLESCKECSIWLDKQIERKPKEMSKPILEIPTLRCRPEIPNSPEDKKEKGLLAMYLSGLKYGLTFGISVIIAISIFGPVEKSHENQQTEVSTSFVSKEHAIPSFVTTNIDNENNEIDIDIDKEKGIEKEFVTIFEIGNSQLVSFVEDEIIPSFNEETLEELSWLENQSG